MLYFKIFLFFSSLKALISINIIGGETSLTLYTKQSSSDKDIKEFVVYEDMVLKGTIDELIRSNYLCWQKKESCTTYFIIHGFLSNSKVSWVTEMKYELFKRHAKEGLINVFTLSWAVHFESEVFHILEYKKYVQEKLPKTVNVLLRWVGELLNSEYMQKNETTAYMHCIGHSLGAQLCGLFAKELYKSSFNLKPRRITGLDPAGPLFINESNEKRLYKTDALFVDIIHTSKTFGFFDPIGHVDFYPNGGINQNCLICSHGVSHDYFIASINNCSFVAYFCANYENYLHGRCLNEKTNFMGLHAVQIEKTSLNMTFYLETNKTRPFCLTDTCEKNKQKGFCTPSSKYTNANVCNKLTNFECNPKKNNYWCCPEKPKKKLTEIDLAIVIDSTKSLKLTSVQFIKTIQFVESLIRKSDVNPEGTRIALISYSAMNVRTLAYFNDINAVSNLVNILQSIAQESNEEDLKPQLENALRQCQKVFLEENGMRGLSKGITKQIVIFSAEDIGKNWEAAEIQKQLGQKGF